MVGSKSCSEQGGTEAVKDGNSREKCNLEWTLQMIGTDLKGKWLLCAQNMPGLLQLGQHL